MGFSLSILVGRDGLCLVGFRPLIDAGFEGKGRRGSGVGRTRGTESGSLWLAPNPSKRWGELFFLFYTPFWLTLCLGIIVPYKLYEVTEDLKMSGKATQVANTVSGDGDERAIRRAHALSREIGAKGVVEAGVDDFLNGVEAKSAGFDCGSVDPGAADAETTLEDEDTGAPTRLRGQRCGNQWAMRRRNISGRSAKERGRRTLESRWRMDR